ncbi:mycofactocin dehydrogenase MftG [Amycolatopsis pithecellobii]|uniref:mycofactocin dehydrogenase MftG n=1 Tax=Amycolatopsis pithecellobii TaxID=664692 RepID=UPI0012BA32CF|nr:mycofactocin system GMC family oxidoreductase MftG [Amycolatopsis pithecellobii]
MKPHYDVIVVGSGSAGGVVASRLSDDPSRTVLLLEAGEAYGSQDEFPERLLDPRQSAVMPGQPGVWRRVTTLRPGSTAHSGTGKVLGGTSSVNAAYFIRGLRADFDGWAKLGNTEWSYDKVLPSFTKSENDADFHDRWHGSGGPIPVRREAEDRAPEFIAAFREACLGHGFPEEADKNGDQAPGVGPVPLNIGGGVRVGSALGYVLPRLGRENFDVRGNAHVVRLLVSGGRATGAELLLDGTRTTVHGEEIIVACGAFRSPQLLLLSGIGRAEQLAAHGIDVRADLPGVGRGLHAHPGVVAPFSLRNPIESPAGRGAMASVLHWSADGSKGLDDLEILPFMRTTVEAGDALGSAVLAVMNEDSRGCVTLASADPEDEPNVDFDFLRTQHDVKRGRELVRTFFDLFNSPSMRGIGAATIGLDREDVRDAQLLDAWVKTHLTHGAHEAATCRMGPDSDPMAVVDQFGRVKGVEGLRVCDTSIWPTTPSRGPAATAIMTGEHIAAFIEAGQ